MKIKTGFMPFHQYQTYYRIVGDLKSDLTPLLLLHGGPGSSHNYFEVFDQLAAETGRPVIMYDQLGCGQSSIPDRPELWHATTWVDELAALRDYLHLDRVHLLGQSWGGMLAIIYLCERRPAGIQSLILASTLSSSALWSQEQHRLIAFMSPADRAAMATAEQTGDFSAPEYVAANQRYMIAHASGPVTATSAEYLRRPKVGGTQAYQTAWGPNEAFPTGTLADYDYTDRLPELTMPTLVTSGVNDLCTPLVAKNMVDHLPNAEWTLFTNSRHMAFIDETEAYLTRLKRWLNEQD